MALVPIDVTEDRMKQILNAIERDQPIPPTSNGWSPQEMLNVAAAMTWRAFAIRRRDPVNVSNDNIEGMEFIDPERRDAHQAEVWATVGAAHRFIQDYIVPAVDFGYFGKHFGPDAIEGLMDSTFGQGINMRPVRGFKEPAKEMLKRINSDDVAYTAY